MVANRVLLVAGLAIILSSLAGLAANGYAINAREIRFTPLVDWDGGLVYLGVDQSLLGVFADLYASNASDCSVVLPTWWDNVGGVVHVVFNASETLRAGREYTFYLCYGDVVAEIEPLPVCVLPGGSCNYTVVNASLVNGNTLQIVADNEEQIDTVYIRSGTYYQDTGEIVIVDSSEQRFYHYVHAYLRLYHYSGYPVTLHLYVDGEEAAQVSLSGNGRVTHELDVYLNRYGYRLTARLTSQYYFYVYRNSYLESHSYIVYTVTAALNITNVSMPVFIVDNIAAQPPYAAVVARVAGTGAAYQPYADTVTLFSNGYTRSTGYDGEQRGLYVQGTASINIPGLGVSETLTASTDVAPANATVEVVLRVAYPATYNVTWARLTVYDALYNYTNLYIGGEYEAGGSSGGGAGGGGSSSGSGNTTGGSTTVTVIVETGGSEYEEQYFFLVKALATMAPIVVALALFFHSVRTNRLHYAILAYAVFSVAVIANWVLGDYGIAKLLALASLLLIVYPVVERTADILFRMAARKRYRF